MESKTIESRKSNRLNEIYQNPKPTTALAPGPGAKVKPPLLIALLVKCGSFAAFAANLTLADRADGFFFSADAGVSWVHEVSFSDETLGTGKFKFDPGVRLDVGGGYQFSDALAAGIEIGLGVNTVKPVGSEEIDNLTLFQVPILATFRYQIPFKSRFHPYLGAGAGGVYTELDNLDVLGTLNNDFTFAYKGFAGVLYQITQRIDLGLQYKFMGTGDHFQNIGSIQSHSLLVAFSMRF